MVAILVIVVALGALYAFGVFNPTNISTTAIQANSTSVWQSTSSYPVRIAGQSCVVVNSNVYCFTGQAFTANSQYSTNSSYYASLSPEGIGTWHNTTPIPQSFYSPQCVSNDDYIYCVGGAGYFKGLYNGSSYYAHISNTGVITWYKTTPYPLNVLDHQCVTDGNYIYCIGGSVFSQNATNPIYVTRLAYYASISSNGIGNWTNTTSYPQLTAGPWSCFVYSSHIYCNGPSAFAGNATAYYAQESASGVGNWIASEPSLPYATGAGCVTSSGHAYCESTIGTYPIALGQTPACVASGGYIYCIGGSGNIGGTNATYYANLSQITNR